jgi:hypothetical protein
MSRCAHTRQGQNLRRWRVFVEELLFLGVTGVTGKRAIQTAKLLGAGRAIAAGLNEQVLNTGARSPVSHAVFALRNLNERAFFIYCKFHCKFDPT